MQAVPDWNSEGLACSKKPRDDYQEGFSELPTLRSQRLDLLWVAQVLCQVPTSEMTFALPPPVLCGAAEGKCQVPPGLLMSLCPSSWANWIQTLALKPCFRKPPCLPASASSQVVEGWNKWWRTLWRMHSESRELLWRCYLCHCLYMAVNSEGFTICPTIKKWLWKLAHRGQPSCRFH